MYVYIYVFAGCPKKCIHALAADNSIVFSSLQVKPIVIDDGSQTNIWRKEINYKMKTQLKFIIKRINWTVLFWRFCDWSRLLELAAMVCNAKH